MRAEIAFITITIVFIAMAHIPIAFNEGNFRVYSVTSTVDKLKIYRLRHQIYCNFLKWVAPSPTGFELDKHDPHCAQLGAFWTDGSVIAALRFLTSEHPFMLENEFLQLVPQGYRIRKCLQTAEVTRLATLAPIEPRHPGRAEALDVIFKGMYQWSKANGIRYLYFVVGRAFLRLMLIRGFPCKAIGKPRRLNGEGEECVAVLLDWESFGVSNETDTQRAYANWIKSACVWHIPGASRLKRGEIRGPCDRVGAV